MVELGVRRGAPKGLLTIRLVWDPNKKKDVFVWKRLEEKAARTGLKVQEYVRAVLTKHAEGYG